MARKDIRDWATFRPYMIKRYVEEENGIGWTKSFWDYFRSNAIAFRNREAVVDTFYGIEPEKRRRRTWREAYNEINIMIFNLWELNVGMPHVVISQLPNCIENWYMMSVCSKLKFFYHYAQIELGEAEVKAMLDHLDPIATVIVPDYHGRPIAKWHLEHQATHPNLKYIFVLTRPGEEVPEGTRPFSDLLDHRIRERYDDLDLEQLATDPNEPLYLPPTGGATGTPRVNCWTMRNYHGITEWGERGTLSRYDNTLLFGTMNGGTGRPTSYMPMFLGGKIIFLTEFGEEDACRLIEEEKITVWTGIPITMVRTWQSPYFQKYDTHWLRVIINAGAPFPSEIGWQIVNKGILLVNCYGSVDAGQANVLIAPLEDKEEQVFSVGKPIGGWNYYPADAEGNPLPPGEAGEIACWSFHWGFFADPGDYNKCYDEKDRCRTGDIGIIDEAGNLRIVGRLKDMILRGGQNIFPGELEELLIKHPKVKEIALVGMPDKDLGEKACAYVVPWGEEKITLEEMQTFLEGHGITKYKWPERIEFIDALPLSTGSKVDKPRLKQAITKKLKEEGKI